MKVIHIKERGGDELHDYKKAVKMAKTAIDIICDLTEEMEDEYGYGERAHDPYRMDSRDGYGERGYYPRSSSGREWDDMMQRGHYYR